MIWKEMKRSYLVISICAVLLGLLLLLLPGPTLATAGICTGVCFIVYGVTKLFEVTRFRNHFANYWLQCVLAFLPIVFGVIFLFKPLAATSILPLILGVFLAVYGIMGLKTSVKLKKFGLDSWWFNLITAVLTILLGALAIFNPFATAAAMVMMMGAILFTLGVFHVVQYFVASHRFKKVGRQISELEKEWDSFDWFWF